jgi:hypothetical protein
MAGAALVLVGFGVPALAGAGQPPGPALPAQPAATAQPAPRDASAWEVRQDLGELLRQYPPQVGRVLQLDPSLLAQPGYLATYPELTAFLAVHPEVARNPAFFFGTVSDNGDRGAMGVFGDVMMTGTAFLAFSAFLGTIAFVARGILDHRRWLRASRVQTEAHTKLLDRFSSNDDLLAYIQTPSGRRFLESGPISVDPGPRASGAPIGRILFSVQAGLVLSTAGIGLQIVSARVAEDVGQGLNVMGVLALSLGVGFILSSAVAFVLSKRLGLLEPPPAGGESAAPEL